MATKKNLFEGLSAKEIELRKAEARRIKAQKDKARGKVKEERDDRELVHETKVRVNLETLRNVVKELENNLDTVGWERRTKEQRSAFHSWNTVSKFAEEHDNGGNELILDVQGNIAGNSKRIYYNPSITSLTKSFRKSIVPFDENHVFCFADIKSAEFIMNCYFAGEQEAIDSYWRGEDVYEHYRGLFPDWVTRDALKTTLLAWLYGGSSYSTSLRCGISEAQADRLILMIERRFPRLVQLKAKIIRIVKEKGYYVCPDGFDQDNLLKVAEFGENGFNPNMAWSAYTQSALAVFMRKLIDKVQPRINGTILSVFDSLLVEVGPNSVERYAKWLEKNMYPFRIGKVTYGKTFYEAYKDDKS